MNQDTLWKQFPKTLLEFERQFSKEEQCRAFVMQLRWGGPPSCQRCQYPRMWALKSGRLECGQCRYTTSVTAGTIFHRSQKPLTLWFRAIWEMVTRKNGLSAKDLQRILGFSSYETAWRWLHKLRSTLDPRNSAPLSGPVQLDEGMLGPRKHVGKMRLPETTLLVAAEPGGRVRLAQGPGTDSDTVKTFVHTVMAHDAAITADAHGSHHRNTLGQRLTTMVRSETCKQGIDPLQHCHWAILLVKRWWMGTHHGAIGYRYTQAYLDEFVFRYNRRKTHGVGRLVARVLQKAIASKPRSQKQLKASLPCAWFVQPSSIG